MFMTLYLFAGGQIVLNAQPEFRLDAGRSFVGEKFAGGQVYEVWLVSAGYAWKFTKTESPVRLNGYAELHYGDASTISFGRHDFDLISNLGIEFLWQFHRSIAFRVAIGSGPGYQSSSSGHQARGFIFSNNFSGGFKLTLGKQKPFNATSQFRFRHMSNASLENPNFGIDNFLFLVGVAVPL